MQFYFGIVYNICSVADVSIADVVGDIRKLSVLTSLSIKKKEIII